MRSICFVIATALMLTGCATAPPVVIVDQPAASLFDDRAFAQPLPKVSADDIFDVTDEMRRYIANEIAVEAKTKGRSQALFDALYRQGGLKLDYDSSTTRNAADTFAAKTGNCLALTIMTAAFAREMGLHVRFQSVPLEEQWSRVGSLYVASGHVNITLSGDPAEPWRIESRQRMTIDFFPPSEWRGRKPKPIGVERIAAMYMNNRAAEALMQNRIAEAYVWAKGAALRDPDFFIAHNTLGVVYRRNGSFAQAQRAFEHVLALAPNNLQALSNLALVMKDQGRFADADAINLRLAALQPDPPYHYFAKGQEAYAKGDLETARQHFAREVERAAYNAEFHYWLAVTHYRLGNRRDAAEHLARATESSTTSRERELYGAKLKSLQAVSRIQ